MITATERRIHAWAKGCQAKLRARLEGLRQLRDIERAELIILCRQQPDDGADLLVRYIRRAKDWRMAAWALSLALLVSLAAHLDLWSL